VAGNISSGQSCDPENCRCMGKLQEICKCYCSKIGFFCRKRGLFCRNIGLFYRKIGLLFIRSETYGEATGNMSVLWQKNRAFLALLQENRIHVQKHADVGGSYRKYVSALAEE